MLSRFHVNVPGNRAYMEFYGCFILARDDIAEVKKHGKLWQPKWRSFFRCLGQNALFWGKPFTMLNAHPILRCMHSRDRSLGWVRISDFDRNQIPYEMFQGHCHNRYRIG